MTPDASDNRTHRLWRFAYRALLPLLPHGLRTRQGGAMLALFDRELQRCEAGGAHAVWIAGVAGLADLAVRGVHERLSEERRALTPANVVVLRHATRAFLVTSVALTALLVAKATLTRTTLPVSGTVYDAVLFSIPYTAALTIPMSVFIAVLWAASRRPSGARNDEASGGVRFAPVIGMASVVAFCCLALNAELVPRANLRLQAMYTGQVAVSPSDRSMTLSELREAESRLRTASHTAPTSSADRATLAAYEVEVQKKFALAAACVVLALLAMGIARRTSSLRVLAIVAISGLVFGAYYGCLVAGEQLVDGAIIPPALAMWSANLIALVVATLTIGVPRSADMVVASSAGAPSGPMPQ
jgi:Lipopolysaccharide export system permease LptF/LptG